MEKQIQRLVAFAGLYAFFLGTLLILWTIVESSSITHTTKMVVVVLTALLYTCIVILSSIMTRISDQFDRIVENLSSIEENLPD